MKIKFLMDRVVQDANAGTPRETRFRAGQIADLPEPSAHHWLTRGVAEPCDGEHAGGKSAKGEGEKK